MSEVDSYITTGKFTKARDSEYYVVKEIEIEHPRIRIETPYKVIEGKRINKESVNEIAESVSPKVFESGIYVAQYRSWKRLHYLLEEAEEDRIHGLDAFFDLRKNLWDSSLTTLSLVFARNPFVENAFSSSQGIKRIPPLEKDSYESLLDYVHVASKALVLSPDIRIKKGDKTICLDEYLTFVDNNLKILSELNKKALFVPIQIHLSQKRLREVLEHYKKSGYMNIWVNFNASHIGGTYFARVRTLLRLIDEIMGLRNTTLYFSHIKKEINPHVTDEKAVGSDILSQFFSADFIGITRNPLRVIENREERVEQLIMKGEFESKKEYEEAQKLHKSRIFDPKSYYYYKIDRYPHEVPFDKNVLLNRVEINKLFNSVLIYEEVERTKKFVEEQKIVKPYIKDKKALEENKEIFDTIISDESNIRQTGLFEFLGDF